MRFCREVRNKEIVFTSSIAPYGAAEDLKTEDTLPTPNTPYGISKLVAEKIHTIWQAKKSNERQLTIVRPGVVFGKGKMVTLPVCIGGSVVVSSSIRVVKIRLKLAFM